MISCKSQSPIYTFGDNNIPAVIPNNAYIKDTNNILNKFVGTWKYENNGKNFVLDLQKIMAEFSHYYVDELNGFYKYTDGSLTIIDTSNYTNSESKISGRWFRDGNLNKITLFFYDPERDRLSFEVILTYSNQGGVEKLNWNLKVKNISQQNPIPGVILNPGTDVRVPMNMVLIKQ